MSNPLRFVLDAPEPAAPPARTGWDWGLVTIVTVSAVLEALVRPDMPLRALAVALAIGLAPLLLWRRTYPLRVVAITFGLITAVDVVLLSIGSPTLDTTTMVYVLLLAYSLFRWGTGWEPVAGAAIITASAIVAFLVRWTGFADAIGGVAVLLAAFAVGWAVRSQQGALARRLEHVKWEERVLLARELHDTVAHHVSAIAVQAQAGRALASTSPPAPLEALAVIEVEASRTLAEMRAMVRVLRDGAPVAYAPRPGVADLEQLVRSAPAGPRVEVTVSGDVEALPVAIDAAVFRIAQEAVTNALRHARHATVVDVRVSADPSSITLVVRDDGDTTTADPRAGFGLTGMVERALLLGGTCQAGPSPNGGWSVVASLPRQVAA